MRDPASSCLNFYPSGCNSIISKTFSSEKNENKNENTLLKFVCAKGKNNNNDELNREIKKMKKKKINKLNRTFLFEKDENEMNLEEKLQKHYNKSNDNDENIKRKIRQIQIKKNKARRKIKKRKKHLNTINNNNSESNKDFSAYDNMTDKAKNKINNSNVHDILTFLYNKEKSLKKESKNLITFEKLNHNNIRLNSPPMLDLSFNNKNNNALESFSRLFYSSFFNSLDLYNNIINYVDTKDNRTQTKSSNKIEKIFKKKPKIYNIDKYSSIIKDKNKQEKEILKEKRKKNYESEEEEKIQEKIKRKKVSLIEKHIQCILQILIEDDYKNLNSLSCCLAEDKVKEFFIEKKYGEGISKTPRRSAEAFVSLTEGYGLSASKIVNKAIFNVDYSGMMYVRDISLSSLCEHHLLPFIGKCHIAYIPDNKIFGLSKFARLVDMFSRRLQVQERLCNEIADAIERILKPKGIVVVIQAAHMCMVIRGVSKTASTTVTTSTRGVFNENSKFMEFLNLLNANESSTKSFF